MKQSNWEEDFDAQFPEKDTFASSWAYFEVKGFIRETLLAQGEMIVGKLEKMKKEVQRDHDGYPLIKSLENVGYNECLLDVIQLINKNDTTRT